jgi:ABC-type uncharacterized transport system auxiliary subunit
MDRIRTRAAFLFAALMSLVLLAAPTGCGWLALAMYAVTPDDVPAKFKDLQEKRVVVVCRPVAELQFADSAVPRDLTRQVGILLKQKVRKIDLVDEREVSEWADENSWQKFTEVGKALKADMVVGIELEHFTLQQGPTLFQGHANIRVVVNDMQSGGRQVYEASLPQVTFPTHTPVPSSEKSEAEFRGLFIKVLAEQIGRHFYPHDSRVDFATDANL